jgi:SEL1 protein
MSALAMWNFGWMYKNGVGVPQVFIFAGLFQNLAVQVFYCQDFHLAKRLYDLALYDLALETNSEVCRPVILSFAKLYARSTWHTLMRGTGGLNIWSPDENEIGMFVW